MKKLLTISLLLVFSLTGCKFINERFKKDSAADTLSAWEAKQDSIKRAEMLKAKRIEEARLARERAIQDSLQRVREMEARNRFHVIIGSFKVPNNADDYKQQVTSFGFQDPRILDAPNGFRLVSVGAYETYSKAANEILRINRDQEEPMELWIYEARSI